MGAPAGAAPRVRSSGAFTGRTAKPPDLVWSCEVANRQAIFLPEMDDPSFWRRPSRSLEKTEESSNPVDRNSDKSVIYDHAAARSRGTRIAKTSPATSPYAVAAHEDGVLVDHWEPGTHARSTDSPAGCRRPVAVSSGSEHVRPRHLERT